MTDLNEAREFFNHDIYATKTTGIELLDCSEGFAKCQLPIGPALMNAVGTVMGGAIYTLADFCFAAATNAPDHLTVTTTSEISYFTTPHGSVLFGECRVVKDGKRTCFAETTITDDTGAMIARVTACGLHL